MGFEEFMEAYDKKHPHVTGSTEIDPFDMWQKLKKGMPSLMEAVPESRKERPVVDEYILTLDRLAL